MSTPKPPSSMGFVASALWGDNSVINHRFQVFRPNLSTAFRMSSVTDRNPSVLRCCTVSRRNPSR